MLFKFFMYALYASPIRSIFRDFWEKLVFAVLLTPAITLWEPIEQVFLSTPLPLLWIVFSLWLLDLASGIFKVIRTEGFYAISSTGLRQSVVKLIEYTIFLIACDAFASTGSFAPYPLSEVIPYVDEMGAIILAATELRSVDENVRMSILGRIRSIADFGGLFQEGKGSD